MKLRKEINMNKARIGRYRFIFIGQRHVHVHNSGFGLRITLIKITALFIIFPSIQQQSTNKYT